MIKKLTIILCSLIILVTLTACANNDDEQVNDLANKPEIELNEAIKGAHELGDNLKDINTNTNLSEEEKTMESLNSLAAFSGKIEKQEFDKLTSLELPESYPKFLFNESNEEIKYTSYESYDDFKRNLENDQIKVLLVGAKSEKDIDELKQDYLNLLKENDFEVHKQTANSYGLTIEAFAGDSLGDFKQFVKIELSQFNIITTVNFEYKSEN